MNTVLFNFHDIVLIATVFLCALLSIVMFSPARENGLSNVFLVVFFASLAMVPLDTLINFGAAFRDWSIENLPDWFYIFELGYWLQGPFLLWFLRSIMYKNYRLRFVDIFYLAPFLLIVMHQLLAYHLLPSDVKATIQRDYSLASETSLIFFITLARELLRLYFGVLCVLDVRHYLSKISPESRQKNSGVIAGAKVAMYTLVGLWAWACVIAVGLIVNVQLGTQLPIDLMGLMANYGTCLLLAGLVVVLARRTLSFSTLPKLTERSQFSARTLDGAIAPAVESNTPPVNPVYVARLEELIHQRKIYLEPSLTVEILATEMSVSPRTLSTILNKHYGSSFFEFINTLRIEEAKKLLLSEEYKDATMLDVMYKVGFKSKATFNNFFRKMESMTPREFKKNNISMGA